MGENIQDKNKPGANSFTDEFGAILPFALIIQEEGEIVFANTKAQRLFSGTGSDKVEIEGRSVAEFLISAVDEDSNGITFQDYCKSVIFSINKVVLPNSSIHDFCTISTGTRTVTRILKKIKLDP